MKLLQLLQLLRNVILPCGIIAPWGLLILFGLLSLMEAMLDTVVLTGLIFQEGYSNFKRGSLRLMPNLPEPREARLLNLKEGTTVFKLEHLFYDFEDRPAAFGWFLVSHDKLPLISKVGVWDD